MIPPDLMFHNSRTKLMRSVPTAKQQLNQLFVLDHIFNHNQTYKMQKNDRVDKIEGLRYIAQFITKEQERELLEEINCRKWNTSIRRRTQHYGYRYSYESVNTLEEEENVPEVFCPIRQQIEAYVLENMSQKGGRVQKFDQLIINEYEPGQGIAAHIDNKVLFSDVIAGLSLGSNTEMTFQKGQRKETLMLQRRSLMVMSRQSRWNWKHSIPARKKDHGVPRGTRISMTWRSVKSKTTIC